MKERETEREGEGWGWGWGEGFFFQYGEATMLVKVNKVGNQRPSMIRLKPFSFPSLRAAHFQGGRKKEQTKRMFTVEVPMSTPSPHSPHSCYWARSLNHPAWDCGALSAPGVASNDACFKERRERLKKKKKRQGGKKTELISIRGTLSLVLLDPGGRCGAAWSH